MGRIIIERFGDLGLRETVNVGDVSGQSITEFDAKCINEHQVAKSRRGSNQNFCREPSPKASPDEYRIAKLELIREVEVEKSEIRNRSNILGPT